MFSRLTASVNHQFLSKSLHASQKLPCRSLHVTCRVINIGLKRNSLSKLSRYSPAVSGSFIRSINTSNELGAGSASSIVDQEVIQDVPGTTTTNLVENLPPEVTPTSLLETIPDAPLPPVVEAVDILKEVGEPAFSSIGLGGWSPIGLVQHAFEFAHVTCDLPWWATIAIGTLIVRVCMFPLVIVSQRNAAKMHNSMPGMQKIQEKISEARNCGDHLEAARATQELLLYMKTSGCNPTKNLIVPLCQAPVFISFFFALKGMANLPVESMRDGGLAWFSDLTVPDPYYLLPIATAGTLSVILHFGLEGPKVASMGMIRYVIQAIPIVILPFTVGFPGAIVWYWTATNLITMVQVGVLRIPAVRQYFKIAQRVTHAPNAIKPKKKFKEGLQDSWTNMKLAREMVDRQQLDRIQFNKAGRGPIEKTYSYNPIQEHLKKEIRAKKSSG